MEEINESTWQNGFLCLLGSPRSIPGYSYGIITELMVQIGYFSVLMLEAQGWVIKVHYKTHNGFEIHWNPVITRPVTTLNPLQR